MAWLHPVIDVPAHLHAGTAQFWSGVLGWPLGPAWDGHPELASFEPPDGGAYVHLQRIDGPPRVHIDLEAHDPGAAVATALRLGAAPVATYPHWHTLRSPGGLPFCIAPVEAHTVPEPVAWPDDHPRMVQVCIDAPAHAFDGEVEFWCQLLSGRFVASDSHEFAGKLHPDGSPLQLLFQRVDDDGPVRAHLDHGTDDRRAEVLRVLALGATDIGPGRGGTRCATSTACRSVSPTTIPPAAHTATSGEARPRSRSAQTCQESRPRALPNRRPIPSM